MRYMVSMNHAGYLPMDDDPAMFDTWAEAWEGFQSFARQWADESDELFDEQECGHKSEKEHVEDCYGSDRTDIDAALADAHINEKTDPDGYRIMVNANDGNVYSLWFVKTEDDDPRTVIESSRVDGVHRSISGVVTGHVSQVGDVPNRIIM